MRILKDIVKSFIYQIIDLCVFVKAAEKKLNSIIIVRIDAIGDFIIWQDAAKEYKKIFKNKNITLVCNELYVDLARKTPYFDEVIALDVKKFEKNLLYRFNFIRKIRNKRYFLAISPVYSRTFFGADWIVKNINADEKIGFDGDLSNISVLNKKISDKWYTKLISTKKNHNMELVVNGEFVRALGMSEFKVKFPDLRYLFSENFEEKAKYCVLFLGAGDIRRRWKVEYFVEIAEKIIDRNIVLCGSKNELSLGNFFVNNYKGKMSVTNLIGETSILEMMEIVKNADFCIGNESSGIHISSSLGIKNLCILGGGHYGRFLPYVDENNKQIGSTKIVTADYDECFGCNWNCKYSKECFPCIEKIKVNKVNEKLKEILDTDI